MKKSLVTLCCLVVSGSALADKTLFSCTTEKNNLVTVIDKGSVFEYRVSNPKVPKADFSFENRAEDVKVQSKTEDGFTGKSIQMTNNGYEYTIVSMEILGSDIPAGVAAKDPQGKIVSEVYCKKFAEAMKQSSERKKNTPQKEQNAAKPKVFGEGVYRVGKDIPAGEYQLKATGKYGGFFRITKDSTRAFDSIVSGDNFRNNTYITVIDGQYLELDSCVAEKVE